MDRKVTEMYAFVATDKEGQEGVMGFGVKDGSWMPMVGADLKMVDKLRPLAKSIANAAGIKYKILHFKLVGEIEK